MNSEEYKSQTIAPVIKALSKNQKTKQAKAARIARYRAASRRMERYDT